MENLSDDELVAIANSGCEDAMSELYRRHRAWSVGYARQLMPSQTSAEDVAAEAVMRVLVRVRAGAPVLCFRSYLATAVRHAAFDQYRRNARASTAFHQVVSCGWAAPQATEDFADSFADNQRLRAAFATLKPRYQHVLWCAIVQDQPLVDIAEELDLNRNATAAVVHRARLALRVAYHQINQDQTPTASDQPQAVQPADARLRTAS